MELQVLRKRIEDKLAELERTREQLSQQLELVEKVEPIAAEFSGRAAQNPSESHELDSSISRLWRRPEESEESDQMGDMQQ